MQFIVLLRPDVRDGQRGLLFGLKVTNEDLRKNLVKYYRSLAYILAIIAEFGSFSGFFTTHKCVNIFVDPPPRPHPQPQT